MTSSDVIAATLKNLDDAQLLQRWNDQMFSEEALPIARAELERRGIEAPAAEVLHTPSTQARGTSAYVSLRLVRALLGFIAAWQVLGLLPIIGWLFNLGATNGGMWAVALIKSILMLVAGGLFFWLGRFVNRLHMKKHGKPHPGLYTQWTL